VLQATNLNKESLMRMDVRTLGLIAVVVLLMSQSGCAKSIHANAGSKATDQPARARVSMDSTERAAKSESSLTEPGRAESSLSERLPSLSAGVEAASRQRGERTDDLLVAKAEPSDASRRQVDELRQEQSATTLAGLKDIYFGYDSWTISETGREALVADAEWLRSNPRQTVTIEGHCDERGTQSYNLVLGEKRAKAVQDFLRQLGVPTDRMRVVSYGKDRPFCKERDESCYQQNRRGHIAVRVR
jgi:peptidoglycan-associated lipoprotein